MSQLDKSSSNSKIGQASSFYIRKLLLLLKMFRKLVAFSHKNIYLLFNLYEETSHLIQLTVLFGVLSSIWSSIYRPVYIVQYIVHRDKGVSLLKFHI